MSGSLFETLTESERQTNRSCAIASLWIAAVCTLLCLLGLTGALILSPGWMFFYFGVDVLPLLAVAAYAKLRDYRGFEIKFLMIGATALVPASMAVPSLFGFFLMAMPIVVAGRYFSRRFVWEAYLMTIVLTFVMTIPHARYGIPNYPLCDESKASLLMFLDGKFDRLRYWRFLICNCFPSFVICMSFFTITVSRLCKDHLEGLTQQAKTNARLADVEKGLFLAAASQVMTNLCPSFDALCPGEEGQRTEDSGQRQESGTSDFGRSQPDVANWSTQAIADCIARCKRRAAADPAFAALVERDPAAAVKEVQS